MTPRQWQEDLAYTLRTIREVHPDPWLHISSDQLETAARELERRFPGMTDGEAAAGLMGLVALLSDGHTALFPSGPRLGFDRWFPVRLFMFEDGLFISAIDAPHREALGGRVERIGRVTATEAFDRAMTIVSHDNRLTQMHRAPGMLASAEILSALGVNDSLDRLDLEVRLRSGERKTITLESAGAPWDMGWFHQTDGLPGGVDAVTATDLMPRPLPLPLRNADRQYWFEYLEPARTLYVKLNAVLDGPDESLAQFCERMWRFVDGHEVDRFILDLRHNGGGNNRLLKPLLHGIIKRDRINQRGRLFTITGRQTFSAAMNCVGFLEEHTRTLFVGEPPGATPNHPGDHERFTLPHSGMTLAVSKYFWLNTVPWDRRPWIAPHLPAPVRSDEFFAGHDAPLETILALKEYRSLADRMWDAATAQRLQGALDLLQRHRQAHPDSFWSTSESDLNLFGYRLMNAGRLDDAIEIFRLNTRSYPDSWNVWDSLGEALMKRGDRASAVALYQKSLELNPRNVNATRMLQRIREG